MLGPRHIVAGALHMLAAAGGRFALAGLRPLARSRLSSSLPLCWGPPLRPLGAAERPALHCAARLFRGRRSALLPGFARHGERQGR